MINTTITHLLDQQQVEYRLLPHAKPTTTIEETALERNVSPAQMVKCILLRDMGDQYALACSPGDRSVDPKKVRTALKCRRMTCVDFNDVESITGFKVGCVGPLALTLDMPIFFDPSILEHKEVTISSGDRMAGIAISTDDLITLVQPTILDICRELNYTIK